MCNRALYTYINVFTYHIGMHIGRQCAHIAHGLAMSLVMWCHVVW